MIETSILPAHMEEQHRWKAMGKANGHTSSTTPTSKDTHQKHPSRHGLLGSRVAESNDTNPSWQNVLDVKEVSWLAEHVLLNQIMFPAAGYIAMAGESMRQLSNGSLESYIVRDFSIISALLVKPDEKLELRTSLQPVSVDGETGQWYRLQIASYDGSHWIERCIGKVSSRGAPSSTGSQATDPEEVLQRHIAPAYWYDVVASSGLKYGPTYQGLSEISTSLTECKAIANIPFVEDTAQYILHPVAIDQCLQILMVAACKGQGRQIGNASVLTAIEHLVISSGRWAELKIVGTATKKEAGGLKGDVSAVSENGSPIISIRHCETSVVPNERPKSEDKLFSFIKWDTDVVHCNLNQVLARSSGDLARVLKVLAHKNPKLRVLELGNGADQTTRLVLKALESQYGERLYLTYTYAVTSSSAMVRAKEAFKNFHDVEVVSFDSERQVPGQSLKAGAYDLIITADFVSPTRNMKTCVNSLKQLVHPLGHVLLLDTLQEPELASLVKDRLAKSPLMTTGESRDEKFISQVHSTLRKSGFIFGPGYEGSSTGPKVFAELRRPLKHPDRVTIIIPGYHHPLANAIQNAFQDRGIDCDRCTFEGDLPKDQDIISIMDFGDPYVYNITEAKFRDFTNRLSDSKSSMIWVTPAAQMSCNDPNSSMILGLTRTLRAELRRDITVVEISVEASTYTGSSKSLLKIYQGLSHRPKARDVDPDYEYAIVDGEIKIPRIQWTTGEEELSNCMGLLNTDESGSQGLQAANGHTPMPICFHSDACYLLVGGLGGLGRVISTWMVENGARNILFLSRSAKEGPETTPFFDELRSQGCEVTTFAGSVNSLSDVEAAIKQATKPVAGVMQMSAVMRDNWMSHMTFSEWDQCTQPKVQGTWNLHKATSSSKLDFFLLFSSICGMSGQWGQGNYNAANSFLDAFVNYRHGQGLSASVVDIGFMGSVGMAMENSALVEKLKTGGYYFLGEQDLIDALTIAIAHSHPGEDRFMNKSQLGLGFRSTKPITKAASRVVWKKDARMVLSHHFDSMGMVTDDEARESLRIAYQGRNASN